MDEQPDQKKQLQDIKKKCSNCQRDFIITVKDQEFYQKMVATGQWESYIEPKKCMSCRRLSKQSKPSN